MARKGTPLTDDELLSAIDSAEALALGANQSTIATDRADAIDRYLGKPYVGDLAAPPGRSSVTSRDVADVVEGVLANVIKPFVGGEEVVRFDPLGPDDEERAQQETDYVNWVALERNNGFLTLNACMKDALLLRCGYVKMGWTKRSDVMLETYEGLSDEEVALIAQDKDVEVVAHNEYPDPMAMPLGAPPGSAYPPPPVGMPPLLHDLKLRRAKPTEYVETLPCPPEEILVSQRQRTPGLQEADFVQQRTHKTLSELRQMGYEVDDDITDDDDATTIEDYARQRQSPGDVWDDSTQDRARRTVLFKETWLRVDKDGDGIAELRRVCQVGRTLLADEETDIVPIAAFCPILMPHQHQGISIFDMVEDLAKLKTALMRQFMDNKYLSNNSRVFANTQTVNIDDLLISRPGGVVRIDGPVTGNVEPMITPDTGASALQGLEYLDAVRESRTGYTRQSQGLETDALVSKTVGGMMMQLSQSQLRLEMIARTLAETGVREMFKIIHALTLKHSTRAEKVRLRNKWVDINPREWVRRTDLSISVGIGSASQQTMMSGLMLIAQAQEKAMPLGLVMPDNVYNLTKKISNAAGFRNVEEFFTPPTPGPDGKTHMPPPPEPPQVLTERERQKGDAMKIQATLQHEAQLAQMKAQGEAQLKQMEMQLHAKMKEMEQQGALALQQSNDQRQSALDQQKFELEQMKSRADQELQIQIANIRAASAVEVARIGAGTDDGTALLKAQADAAGYGPIVDALKNIMETVSAPKEIVRDANGRATGVQAKKPTMQ